MPLNWAGDFPGSCDRRKEAAGAAVGIVRSIVTVGARRTCAGTSCGAGVCATAGRGLARNTPSSTLNRLYPTRFLSLLILALHHGSEGTHFACLQKLSLSPDDQGPDFAVKELDCCERNEFTGVKVSLSVLISTRATCSFPASGGKRGRRQRRTVEEKSKPPHTNPAHGHSAIRIPMHPRPLFE